MLGCILYTGVGLSHNDMRYHCAGEFRIREKLNSVSTLFYRDFPGRDDSELLLMVDSARDHLAQLGAFRHSCLGLFSSSPGKCNRTIFSFSFFLTLNVVFFRIEPTLLLPLLRASLIDVYSESVLYKDSACFVPPPFPLPTFNYSFLPPKRSPTS